MFTRIFGKTTFLSYFIAFLVLIAAVFWHHNVINEQSPVDENTFKTTIIGILATISLFCVEWTVRRQKLFSKGSYHLLVFALFFWILPINRWDIWLWFASLFFWFSFLQITQIDGSLNSKKAVFNAGFWLVFAVFFKVDFIYFSLTMFLILFFKGQLNYKNTVLFFLPAFCISIIWLMLLVLIPSFPSWETPLFTLLEFSFLRGEELADSLSFIFVLLSAIVVVLKYLKGVSHNSNKSKNNIYNMILLLVSALGITLFGGEGNEISWVSLLMIIAVLSTQYFESFSKKWPIELFFVCCMGIIFQDQILSIFN
tara:strand:- start:11 stop:946 length:936 start_codon:yes stop_codon:yes gene_type:complete